MVLKQVGVWSAARVMGVIYAGLGLVFGALFAFMSIIMSGVNQAMSAQGPMPAMMGAMFGIGAVVFMPILYGLLGVASGAVTAWLYNTFSRLVGGLELEFE